MTDHNTCKWLAATAAIVPGGSMAQQHARPNIMIVMVDDMGYSDPECFGGEVHTPNLNSLAEEGMRFTQFFNCGRSCPSRGSMLTGLYAQQCGITGMGVSLNRECVTIAEVLKAAGYNTAISGKWHLSLTRSYQGNNGSQEQLRWLSHQDNLGGIPFSPLDTYPCNRGFDEHWGTIWGVCNHFDPFSLVHNEQAIYEDSIPQDFYSSDFVTQKATDMLDTLTAKAEPFFLYVAYNAPHWPLHAKVCDIEKYRGAYDDGWDALLRRRYKKMVEMGLVRPEETPNAPNASGRLWDEEKDKAFQSANMEVHAAMVDCVDQGIGRIIDKLKETGAYDNTIIIFSSDNGASSENYPIGDFDRHNMKRDGQMVTHNSRPPGDQLSYNYLGTGWAGAVNTPFRYWKRESFHGGIAAPTIVAWPKGMKRKAKGTIMRQPCQYIDIMPTILEATGATYPTNYQGHEIMPLPAESQSFLPLLTGKGKWNTDRTMFWEHESGKAVRTGEWKLTALCGGKWQLFNMKTDYSETRNVAEEHPEQVETMKTLWNKWAESVGLHQKK